jgi:hypothetical protein
MLAMFNRLFGNHCRSTSESQRVLHRGYYSLVSAGQFTGYGKQSKMMTFRSCKFLLAFFNAVCGFFDQQLRAFSNFSALRS